MNKIKISIELEKANRKEEVKVGDTTGGFWGRMIHQYNIERGINTIKK